MPTYDAEKCRDCDRRLATNSDVRCPCGGGRCEKCDALCWAAFHGGCQDPIDWRERYLAATQEVERLTRENHALRSAVMGACTLRERTNESESLLWAMRQTANLLSQPYSLEAVEAKVKECDRNRGKSTAEIERLNELVGNVEIECERLRKLVRDVAYVAERTGALTDSDREDLAAIRQAAGVEGKEQP